MKVVIVVLLWMRCHGAGNDSSHVGETRMPCSGDIVQRQWSVPSGQLRQIVKPMEVRDAVKSCQPVNIQEHFDTLCKLESNEPTGKQLMEKQWDATWTKSLIIDLRPRMLQTTGQPLHVRLPLQVLV